MYIPKSIMLSLTLQERQPHLLRSRVILHSFGDDKGKLFSLTASLAATLWVVHLGLFPACELLTLQGAV